LKPLDPRLLKTAGAARWFIAGVVALAVLGMSLTLLFAWQLSHFVTAVFFDKAPVALELPALGLVALAGGFRAALVWAQEWLSNAAAATAKSQLRTKLLESISKLGPYWLAHRSSAQLNLLATSQLDALDAYFAKFLPQLVYTVIITPAFTVIVFALDPLSGIALICTLPLIPLFMIFIGMATRSVQEKQLASISVLTSHFVEVLRGLTTLKVFGRAENQVLAIQETSDRYRKRTMQVLRLSFLSGFALEVAASLSVALIAVSIGLRLVNGSLSLYVGLFILLLAPEAYLPLRMVGAHFHASAEGVAASKSVLDIIDEAEQSDGQAMPDTAETITQFAQGAITLIHGPSGSGKTSLLNQLRACLGRDAVSWLPQNVGLMPGSVKENIVGFETTDVHTEHLNLAMDLACLDDLDLDQAVGQATMTVSGGQAQRIGLARTFYRALTQETPWLLLDEPISALDQERSQKVSESLKHLTKLGATVVAVSHQTLPQADFTVLITNA